MPTVEARDYGYRITFEATIDADAAARLLEQLRMELRPGATGFGVLVDLTSTRNFSAEAQELVKQAILICRDAGMERNAVAVANAIAALQARRMVKQTGIAPDLRYIDATAVADWEEAAIAWIREGAEPPTDA